jgi:uncharacterized membrane protein
MDARVIASVIIFALGVCLSISSYKKSKDGDHQAMILTLAWVYGLAYVMLLFKVF